MRAAVTGLDEYEYMDHGGCCNSSGPEWHETILVKAAVAIVICTDVMQLSYMS